ncbi:hypothetical protein [Brevundimonas sp. Root1279]|uniref:hypothetical protein n=1 Tax=Brevundimonas sp. Root1279 TaxID=1736443 RepID=UPI0006F9F751|nr:hypothetical protein [Brevundimonas sp. Root1279]KQW78687.1 hypothetical protein ASC65_15305 [Brevundimonas sp. Root1279]
MTGLIFAALLVLTPPQDNLSGSRNAQTEADFRCFAAGLVMAEVSGDDAEMVNAGSMVAFYYLGRLEGREPSIDWVARGVEVGTAKGEELLPELARCGEEFAAKGEDMVKKAGVQGS